MMTYSIVEVQHLRESGYLHLLGAERPDGVRYSLGCVKLPVAADVHDDDLPWVPPCSR
jgi:hypothetical protein